MSINDNDFVITNDNIRPLVKKYLNFMFDRLPFELRNITMNEWDVSNVTDMSNLFDNYTEFNELINDWDVSNVTNMREMFRCAHTYNQPLNKWNVEKVEDFSYMFSNSHNFNQNISLWKIKSNADVEQMYFGCSKLKLSNKAII